MSANMWQFFLIMTMLASIWYLFRRGNHIPKTQYQLFGSAPWRHTGNTDLEIREDDIYTTIQKCRDVLMSSWREEEWAEIEDVMTLLETRAGPNMRLAESFGIDNPFTTIDEDYHNDFKVKITKALKTSDKEWRRLWILSKEIARDYVTGQEWKVNILLVPLVQSVVFKVVMLKFFPDKSKLDEDAAIANITRLINTIWMDSKRPQTSASRGGVLSTLKELLNRHLCLDRDTKNLAALKDNLAYVLPPGGWEDPRENPLNIILPTYETLWRVVLHCIIEILFRHEDRNGLWKACITKVGQSLDSQGEFSLHADHEGRVSVLDIVNEALRLYPPTKRIYRWELRKCPHGILNGYPELCAADIEALHRDEQVWGTDALQFKPERWSRYSADERKRANDNFLPFGYGSLSCPAKKFAPMMAGMIVVVLVEELKDKFDWEAELEGDRIDGVGPLKTARDSYGTLKLKRL